MKKDEKMDIHIRISRFDFSEISKISISISHLEIYRFLISNFGFLTFSLFSNKKVIYFYVSPTFFELCELFSWCVRCYFIKLLLSIWPWPLDLDLYFPKFKFHLALLAALCCCCFCCCLLMRNYYLPASSYYYYYYYYYYRILYYFKYVLRTTRF